MPLSFQDKIKPVEKPATKALSFADKVKPVVTAPVEEEGVMSKIKPPTENIGVTLAKKFVAGVKTDIEFLKSPRKFTEEVAVGITAERRDRAQKVQLAKDEISTAFASGDTSALEKATEKLHEVSAERSGAEIIADLPADVGASIKTFSQAAKLIPANVKSAYLQATKGLEEASVVNVDQSQKYIRETEARNSALLKSVKAEYGDRELFGLPIKVSDIANLPQTVGFSAVSMGAGLGAGIATEAGGSFVVTPFVATGLAWGAGTAASGKVAFEMATYQITQQYLEVKNAEKIASTGKGLTAQEEVQAKDEFKGLALKYGLWEAIPEAISNAAFLKILTVPLTKMLGNSMASAIAQKVAGLYGEELLTETITQMGQTNVEVKAGMSKEAPRNWLSPEDWSKSFKEIAPQTFLLTTLMAGAGQTIISTGTGYEKIREALTKELESKGASPEEIKKIVETIPSPKTDEKKEIIAEKLAEGDSPNKIALDLSRDMSTEEALALVNEVVAQEQVQPIIPEAVTAPKAPRVALEDATQALKTIDDTLLEKTPAEMQEEFTLAQESIDTKLADIQKNVADIKERLGEAKAGSVQKKTLKIELAKAQAEAKKAEADFNKALVTHAEGFRDFLGEYVAKNFDITLSPAQNEYLINKIVERTTTPDTPSFKQPLKSIVGNLVSAMSRAVKARAEEEKVPAVAEKKAKAPKRKVVPKEKGGAEIKVGDTVSLGEGRTVKVTKVQKEGVMFIEEKSGLPMLARFDKFKIEKVEEKAKEIQYPNTTPEKGVTIYGFVKDGVAKLSSIEIIKSKQRKGLGAKYVSEFEKWAREQGATKINIDAYKKSISFWEKMGYTIEKEFPVVGGVEQEYKTGEKVLVEEGAQIAELSGAEKFIKEKGLDPDSVMITDNERFIVENTAGNEAILVEVPIIAFGKPKFETLNQKKYKAGRKITDPIEATFENDKLTITEGANRFTQALANDDKTIVAVVEIQGDKIFTPEEFVSYLDKNQIGVETKGNGKDIDRGGRIDKGGLPSPLPHGKGEPRGAGDAVEVPAKGKRGKGRPAKRGDELGGRPSARLTNEEVAQKIALVTSVENGEVKITGEITEDILEAANQYKSGGITKEGRGILDEYYTSTRIVDMVKSLFDFPTTPMKVLEPAVGTGNFLYALPEIGTHNVVTHEINETTARIAKIFHNNAKVFTTSFEENFIDERGNKKEFTADYDLVIGNPPYGEHRGKYLGLGEEKGLTKYEDYFVKRGLDVLKEGGTLAMVLPSSYLDRQGSLIGAEIVTAFRLPVGSFEGTDIGTDILVLRKKKGAMSEQGTAYFTNHPENILGTIKERKNRFGKMEKFVEGTLDEAISLFSTNNNESEAITILKDLGVEQTQENIESAEDAIDEAGKEAKELVKEAQKKGKVTIEKKIIKKSIKAGEPVSLMTQFEGQFTDEEIEAWKDTQADGSLKNPEKHSGANYLSGKWYNDFNYAQGDIYEKLHLLAHDLATGEITKEQYSIQEAKLEAVKPRSESIDDLKIAPNISFVNELKLEEGITLKSAFLKWMQELPRQAFGDSSQYEVREYVNNEQVRGSDKDRNELIRNRRKTAADNLFAKFLKDGLTGDQKIDVQDKYNETFNFYHTPDYKRVPMFASIFPTFKGKEFNLRDVQKNGIGGLTNKGVGILAHDVGFGKTISGVVAIHESMHRGWTKKPLIITPSENVYRQWISTINELIPNAQINELGNLGVGFKGDLSALKISDGSITLVTYEGFKRLGFTDATYDAMSAKFGYISDDLQKHKTDREKEKANARAAQQGGVMKKGTRADLSFEELGFDHITFDEVHNANHIVSKVKLEKGKASEFNQFTLRPSDLGMKTWLASQYIQEKNGGRNVNLLSATPFTNHPLEYYSILSLVADKSLQKMGLTNVNEFFGTFMEAESDYEFKADGTYQKKTDIRRFRNFRQFRKLLDTYIDFKDGEAEGIVRPTRVQQTYEIPQNQFGLEMEARAQAIFKENEKESGQGAKVLRAITELRKIAFSPYASKFSPDISSSDYKLFVENSPKIKTLMGLIAQNKKDNTEAGQIVYVDQVGVSFMPLMKDYLVKEIGYKASEVEIISGATAKPKRVEIQDKFNKGEVKIVIGSEAIKEGMNLQETTSDLYILSLPWNFTQLRQVIGRAWRQGNMWKNVRINNLFIQDSVDIFLSQKLDNKQKRYEAAIKSADQEVDVGDVSFDELKFELIRDPETRAKLELQASKERLSQEITQARAELAFATRKLEKINELATEIADTVKYLAQEEEQQAKALKEGKEYSDWWIEKYKTDLVKLRKQQGEELGKLKEKGIDTESLIKTRTEGEIKIKELEAEEKALDENFDTRLKEIAASLPARKPYSQAIVDNFVADRTEQNKTFYELREDESEATLKVEETVKEIKNAEGTKVVKTKKTIAVTRTPKVKVSGTKDTAMLKILADTKLTVQQKVDTLLDKRQEGKKYKDVGERVAGSKKENAIIQAVIEHGDSDILRKLADELGNEVIVEQLNKQKILEGIEIPNAEAERKAGTPAFVAAYKIGVFNKIARTPVIIERGGRYSSYQIVRNDQMQDFIVKYPEELRKFVTALNAISTPEKMNEFETTYRNWFFDVTDAEGETKTISINTLGKNFGKVLDPRNVSAYSGKFKQTGYPAIKEYEEAKNTLIAIENDGVFSEYDTYDEKMKYYPLDASKNEDYIPKTSWKSFDTKEEARTAYETQAKETKTDIKATFARAKTHYEASLKDLNENYDKYIPKVEMGKAKQIADAEKNVADLARQAEEYKTKADTGEKYYKEALERTNTRLVEARAFLARLKGEEVALTHGNFQAIEEYDVKDSRFKKTFVNTDNLMKVYGFKSAQLGNYMDDVSAREHIVQTMGAIEDMSKILGVDFPTISNKMQLSIAFGARGGGGAAVAHFEPTHKIINITKKRGDGSFGHEFMHALDYILGAGTYRGKWSTGNGYGSYRSYAGDKESMLITRAFVSGVKIDTEKTFAPQDDFNEAYANTIIEMRREGKTLAEAKTQIDTDTPETSYQREIYYQALADVYREPVTATLKTTSKDYYEKSLKYGGGKDTSYWVRKEELWARAFQAYLEDKMEEAGIKNNYLTRSTKIADVYPQGAERKEFNKLFDDLFREIGKSYPIVEGVEMRFKKEGAVTETYTMTDAGNYLADLKDRLKIDFDVHFVDNILATKDRNPVSSGLKTHIEAYGATADNTIALVREMANLTAEHESVHLTLTNMNKIRIFERNGITRERLLEAKAYELGIDLTDKNVKNVEEAIANDFEAYILDKKTPKGIIRKFFILLKQLITRFAKAIGMTHGDILNNYFDVLIEGREVDEEMVRLENKGIMEAYTEDGVLDTEKMLRVLTPFDTSYKVKDEGDKYLQKVEEKYNELATQQMVLEIKTREWKDEVEKKLVDREDTAKIIVETPESVKELSRYTTRVKPPVGALTALGEVMVDQLGFEDKQSAETEVQEYLKRKTELVVTRNRLRQLRADIAKAKREGKTTRASLRDVERRLKLRKELLERKDYYIGLGIGRGQKEQMKMIRLRRRAISGAQDFFALSDKKAKEIIANRNIHLMGEGEFNDFLIEFTNKAEAMRQVLDIRDEAKVLSNEFGKFDNLRLALGLPAIEKMSKDQAQRFVDALANYQVGDIFLSKRVLETIHRTDWGNIATERELLEKVEEVTGIPKATILATHPTWWELVKNDALLARKDEFMNWLVNNKHKAIITASGEFAGIENKVDELTKKARASRRAKMGVKEKIVDILIPTDTLVFNFIEAKDKMAFQKENKLTREELALADYLIAEFSKARDHLAKEYKMKERQNYITHIRRSFLEILKAEGSVWAAIRELYTSAKEDEASFKIMNDQTGEVLAFEKFFGFSMHRTGQIAPTQNVARAAKEYFRAFTKKKALDKLIPEVMVITNFIDAQKKTTKKGLLKELSTAEFVKRYINMAKGRKFDFGGFLPQGGLVDITIKGLGSVIYFKFLALSIGVQVASYGGEFVSNMRGMTYSQRAKFFTRRLNMSKNRAINEQIIGVTGRHPVKELFGAEHTIPEIISNLMYIGFSHASYTATKGYFRAVTTDEEYNTGIISSERIAEIELMMNKFRLSPNYGKSIVGATSLAGMVNRFKTWAIPHITSSGMEVLQIVRDLRAKKTLGEALSSADAKSLYRGIEITATMTLVVLLLSQLGGDDDPELLKKLRAKVLRDLGTLQQMLGVYWGSRALVPADIAFVGKIMDDIAELAKMEKYTKDGEGYGIGELKGARHLIQDITPTFIKQFEGKEERVNTKNDLIDEAVNAGVLDAKKIAEFTNPDEWNNVKGERTEQEQEEYKEEKIGEITALYHLRKDYPNSVIGEIITTEDKNDKRVEKMVEYAKEVGKDKAYSELKDLYHDRKLCSNVKKKNGCLVSGQLFKDFKKAKKKI